MSAIRFTSYALGYVGDMSEHYGNDPHWAAVRWHRYCADYLPPAPLAAVKGFHGLLVNEDYDLSMIYCPDAIYALAGDVQDRLTYMLTNPTAELRFDPERGFLFNDIDDMIYRLSRP